MQAHRERTCVHLNWRNHIRHDSFEGCLAAFLIADSQRGLRACICASVGVTLPSVWLLSQVTTFKVRTVRCKREFESLASRWAEGSDNNLDDAAGGGQYLLARALSNNSACTSYRLSRTNHHCLLPSADLSRDRSRNVMGFGRIARVLYMIGRGWMA